MKSIANKEQGDTKLQSHQRITGAVAMGLAVLVCAILSGDAAAAIVAQYDFGTAAGTDSVTTVGSNLNATGLSIGVSPTSNVGDTTEFGEVGESNAGNGWSSSSVGNTTPATAAPYTRFIRFVNLANSQTDAVSNNDYFEFTVTPQDGYELDLESFTVDITVTRSSGTATVNYYLRSSVDSFAANLGSTMTATRGTNGTNNYVHHTIDLSGASFQDLSSVAFRLYAYVNSNTAGSSGNNVARLDNVTVNGVASVIPEPASLAMLGLGGVMMLPRRRASAG